MFLKYFSKIYKISVYDLLNINNIDWIRYGLIKCLTYTVCKRSILNLVSAIMPVNYNDLCVLKLIFNLLYYFIWNAIFSKFLIELHYFIFSIQALYSSDVSNLLYNLMETRCLIDIIVKYIYVIIYGIKKCEYKKKNIDIKMKMCWKLF